MLALNHEPTHYADCCLSLCWKLFACLAKLIREVTHKNKKESLLLLSVGCGTGLLETTLQDYLQEEGLTNLIIEGVEVASTETTYLPVERVHRVIGSRTISRRAEQSDILLFVYPRQGSLVKEYLDQHARNMRLILWLGPRADWFEQLPLIHSVEDLDGPVVLQDAGLSPYELAVAYHNRSIQAHSSKSIIGIEHTCPTNLAIDSI